MHGFAGYFESTLYRDVSLSILPSTHTPGMFSWFPLFIPLKTPLRVHRGQTISANFWRQVHCKEVFLNSEFLSFLSLLQVCRRS